MAGRLAALAALIGAGAYLAGALPLPRGMAARPGPGFFPLLVGVFFCATAAAFLVETVRRRAPETATPVPASARARVAATGGALLAFVLLLPWLGYPVVTVLFVAALLRALGGSWTLALATAVASAAASWYLFAVLLAVPLPKGVLFD